MPPPEDRAFRSVFNMSAANGVAGTFAFDKPVEYPQQQNVYGHQKISKSSRCVFQTPENALWPGSELGSV